MTRILVLAFAFGLLCAPTTAFAVWAVKCTRNCVVISKSEAIKRGGVPCKICGGR